MERPTNDSVPKLRLNSIAFLVAVLLFLLPFVNIRCGQNVISNNGIGLAFGIHYKTSKQLESNNTESKAKLSFTEKEFGKLYVSALIAFLLGITGFILSVSQFRKSQILALMGVLAALSLIVLMIQIRIDFKNEADRTLSSSTVSDKWTVEFTAWYYLTIISFIAAALFNYRKKQVVNST